MSLLNKLTKGFSSKSAKAGEEDLAKFKEQLTGILYDEELVDEFAPIFAKLSQHEGFDKVVELLETKERMLESHLSNDWTKQDDEDDTTLEQEQEKEETAELSAQQILEQQFNK